MFLLDTDVLSAMMSLHPDAAVAAWISGQRLDTLFITTLCQAEILAGIVILPEGRRRAALAAAAQAMFADDREDRVLPFDHDAAAAYADLVAACLQAGRPTPTIDLMIAAIARTQGASVVTRNVADFAGCDIAVIDPWQAV